MTWTGALVLASTLVLASCKGGADPPVLQQQSAPAATAATESAVPHGDHNPKYGGIVLMNGDLHFEAVLGRNGHHQLYFSDATRGELPAATASEVIVTVTQKGREPEAVAMRIDESGESWIGAGRPVDDPAAMARVAYTAYGKPYFIDVPFP